MNEKVSRMMRRLHRGSHIGKISKKAKKEFNTFTHLERSKINADYKERSEEVRKQYTKDKKRE